MSCMSVFVEIGRNIAALRKRKGLSQEQLALIAGMSVSCLRAIERGGANPTLDALCRIADALDEPFMSVVSVESLHRPMAVAEILRCAGRQFPVCPRCGQTLEREYQAYCDRCGQCLNRRALPHAVVIAAPGQTPRPAPPPYWPPDQRAAPRRM